MTAKLNTRPHATRTTPIGSPFAVTSRLLIILSLAWILPATAAEFESPPQLRAHELAPAGVPLQGDRYRVDEEVPTDGFLAAFTLRSDFGTVVARGPGVLRMRVGEVEALAQLETMAAEDVFVDALKQSATSLGASVVNIVTNPVEVAKGIPEGVGRFFGRVSRTAKTAAQKLGDVAEERAPGAPRGAAASTNAPNVAVAGGVAAGRATRDLLGYDEQRRNLAKTLGVDPYTTNPILTKKLDQIAWAAFAGGLGVDLVASKVPGGRLARSASMLDGWIYEKPPADLHVWMETSLQNIGVNQETIDLFLRQQYWTLTTQTILVLALEKLDGVEGRAAVLDTAVTAAGEDQVRFLALSLAMLAREHESIPVVSLVAGKPVGVMQDGRAIATAAVDYVCWGERMAEFTHREDLEGRSPTLAITGRLSPRTADEMKKAGWKVRDSVPLPDTF